MVDEGYPIDLKLHNDHSDVLAMRGRDDHSFAGLADTCAKRQVSYGGFMLKLTLCSIAVGKADQAKRDAVARTQQGLQSKNYQLVHVAACPLYPALEHCRAIHVNIFNLWLDGFNKGPHTSYRQIWAFLASLRIRPVILPGSGITWLELFLLFEQAGGTPDLRGTHSGPEERGMPVKQRLTNFHYFVREIIKHFVHSHDQCLFKASPSVQKRLSCLGLSNRNSLNRTLQKPEYHNKLN